MDQDSIRRSQNEANAGLIAIKRGQKEDAGVHLFCALQNLDHVQGIQERRNLLSEISEFFLNVGFEDLALMAVLDAIEIDKRLGLERGLIKDNMTYANIHTRLENMEQAETIYRSLLDRCLKNGDYANAASAATNLAGILANNNYLGEAMQLLENSLEYLKAVDFRDTEINTRLMIVQVLELQKGDPQLIINAARTLLNRFANDLNPPYLKVLAQFVGNAMERYPLGQLDVDAEAWKKREFPELYGDW